MSETGEGDQSKQTGWQRLRSRILPRKPVVHPQRPPIFAQEASVAQPAEQVSASRQPASNEIVEVHTSPEIELRNRWMRTVDAISDVVTSHQAIDDFSICVDRKYPWDIYVKGDLGLWAGMVGQKDGFPFPEAGENTYVVTIKNIQVAKGLRQQGIASEILRCLEGQDSGAAAVIPTNIASESSLHFWQQRGYILPESEKHKEKPYYLYKKIV